MNKLRSSLLLIILITFLPAQGFLKTSGKYIVDPKGNEIILKGIGIGGWLLQEGYMLHTSGFANAEHEIRSKIESLIGKQRTEEIYQIYHENHTNEKDIKAIADWGFNSIRIPLHYARLVENTLPVKVKETGFAEIDKLLNWCKKYNLYLILDLHAAPGGQSDEPISDYDKTKPSLWESQTNQDLTIELWKELAKRYKDETMIGGYDLLNEPKWNLGDNNILLRSFYNRLTDAVRSIDTNHILFIEGNWFATDFNGLTPAWDKNMVYSFHKYWNANDKGAINYLLDLRNNTNTPLWLGETGENSNSWFTECAELMAQNKIGWAWWPHKKIASVAGPLSAQLTKGYQDLLDYWNNPFTHLRPDENVAYNNLKIQMQKLNIDSCKFQPDVIDALIRLPLNAEPKAFKDHKIPGLIYLTDYNFGKRGTAYYDTDYDNTKGPGGATWNSGWEYRNDGVDIEKCTDVITNGYNLGWINAGEWIRYFVTVDETGDYEAELRIASNQSGGKLIVRFEEQSVQQVVDIPVTGGWQKWSTVKIPAVKLTKGKVTLFLQFLAGGYNLNFISFKKSGTTDIENHSEVPSDFKLMQNYPNPFNNQTTINFIIPERQTVKLDVYTPTGELVDTLINREFEAGTHSVKWDSGKLGSGIYFYTLNINGNNTLSRKAILLK